MTVRELIKKLQKVEDKDLKVIGLGRDDSDEVIDIRCEEWNKRDGGTVTYCELILDGFE